MQRDLVKLRGIGMKNYGCVELPVNGLKTHGKAWRHFSRLASLILCDAHHLLRAWAVMLVYQKLRM